MNLSLDINVVSAALMRTYVCIMGTLLTDIDCICNDAIRNTEQSDGGFSYKCFMNEISLIFKGTFSGDVNIPRESIGKLRMRLESGDRVTSVDVFNDIAG
jgi:hypothetical protein